MSATPVVLPPLVEPAAELSREEVARYSRHLIIPNVGMTGQKAAQECTSPVHRRRWIGFTGTALSRGRRSGHHRDRRVRRGRHVEPAASGGFTDRSDVGRPKALSAKESILEINEHVDVRLHEFRLDNSNAVELFSEYDLILDGTDNFATRYLVNDAAVIAGKPYVWGSIYRFEGQVSVFWEDAPDGAGLNYRDLYPEAPPPGMVPSCAEGGVLGVLPATVGSIMATEAVKLITGIGEPLLGRLMIYDALAMTFRTIRLQRDPTRVPVTALIDYDAFCGVVSEEASAAAVGSTITAPELEAMIGEGRSIELVDVREPVEWDIMHLPGAVLIPKDRILSR